MTIQEFRELLGELQTLNKEVKLWGWKTSEEQIVLMGRIDAYYDKIKDFPLCINLTPEKFKSNFLGAKVDRLKLVVDLSAALNMCAFETLNKQILDP